MTGALICRADAYCSCIEGPEVAIRGTYARIAFDNRHVDVNFLFGEPVTDRLFPGGPCATTPPLWMWTQAQVAAGAIARRPDRSSRRFERLKSEAP